MEIKEAIVQGIAKEANSAEVAAKPRQHTSPIDAQMTKLAADLLEVYGKGTSNYGTLSTDLETYAFPRHLQRYMEGQQDFIAFSQATANLLVAELENSLWATGGFYVFLRYTNQGTDWLLVVGLKTKEMTSIDEDSLDLRTALTLDIQHLHEAARIDLDKWKQGAQPYLSFIKRSGRQDDVTKYFRKALGCTDYTDAKFNTETATKAIDAYCEQNALSAEERREVRAKVYAYFEEMREAHEPVTLTALSALINFKEPTKFTDFVKANDETFPVSETFAPHKRSYVRYHRISGTMGNIKVSFDVDDVLHERVDLDDEANILVIRNVSARLREEILKAKGYGAAE